MLDAILLFVLGALLPVILLIYQFFTCKNTWMLETAKQRKKRTRAKSIFWLEVFVELLLIGQGALFAYSTYDFTLYFCGFLLLCWTYRSICWMAAHAGFVLSRHRFFLILIWGEFLLFAVSFNQEGWQVISRDQRLPHTGSEWYLPLARMGSCVSVLLLLVSIPREWTPLRARYPQFPGAWARDEGSEGSSNEESNNEGSSVERPLRGTAEQRASLWALTVTFSWLTPTVYSKQDPLPLEDLPPMPDQDCAALQAFFLNHSSHFGYWHLLRHFFGRDLVVILTIDACHGLSCFVAPLSLGGLLMSIDHDKAARFKGWFYVFGLAAGPLLMGWTRQAARYLSNRLWSRIEAAVIQAIFKSTLDMVIWDENEADDMKRESSQQPMLSRVGMVNNLISSEMRAITASRDVFEIAASFSVRLVISIIILYSLLGWIAWIGACLLLGSFFILHYFTTRSHSLQHQTRAAADARIGLVSEVLSCIRLVKFLGWEAHFQSKIREARQQEVDILYKRNFYIAAINVLGAILPLWVMFAMFITFIKFSGNVLTASLTFTTVAVFDILREMFYHDIQYLFTPLPGLIIAKQRIQAFLEKGERLSAANAMERPYHVQETPSRHLGLQNATLSWPSSNFRLSDVTVTFPPDTLTIVTGPLASGKSSLLMALLGEMPLVQGSVTGFQGAVGYTPQVAWLLNASIKDNIVLVMTGFDEARYRQTIIVCQLEKDLELLKDGDRTMIGEKGMTLSGGQKARICLARAVYSQATTLLLDDIFSALDASTAKRVLEQCIKGDIMTGRTVVLVTHQVQLFLGMNVRRVEVRDGKVIQETDADAVEDTEEAFKGELPDLPVEAIEGQISTHSMKEDNEFRAASHVPAHIFISYIQSFGNALTLFLLLILCLLDVILQLLSPLLLGLLADSLYSNSSKVQVYLTLYGVLCISSLFVSGMYNYGLLIGQRRSSTAVHDRLLSAVMNAPLRFFEKNPVGRIVNRFATDVDALDRTLGEYTGRVASAFLTLALRIVALTSLLPVFLIALLMASIAAFYTAGQFIRTQLGASRLSAVQISPLITHLNDAIAGRVVLRALKVQEDFYQHNLTLIDKWVLGGKGKYNVNRWMRARLSWYAGLIGIAAGTLSLRSKLPSSLVGFSLVVTLGFMNLIVRQVRDWNEFEVGMNSYQRVHEYIDLEQEPLPTEEGEPPASWPSQGKVEFKNVSVSYSKDSPNILHNLSTSLPAGQRIGIVGTTGAGKSSMALSILRFTNITSGKILVDNIDVSNVNIHSLRRRITFIPQDSTCFRSTIRSNLNPEGDICDEVLQQALNDSRLSKDVTLDTEITHDGDNLSPGQKQLLAFARSLLRRSKLIILDEATASTDLAADAHVQETIQRGYKEATLLVIAHRLNTVMGLDRIIVLERGEIIECDTPMNLLAQKGNLWRLAQDSQNYEELEAMARNSSIRNSQD